MPATVLLQQARLLFYGKGQQPAPAAKLPRGFYYQKSSENPKERRVDMW